MDQLGQRGSAQDVTDLEKGPGGAENGIVGVGKDSVGSGEDVVDAGEGVANVKGSVNDDSLILESKLLWPVQRCILSLWCCPAGCSERGDLREFLLDKLTTCFMYILGGRKGLHGVKSLEAYFDKAIGPLISSNHLYVPDGDSRVHARERILLEVFERILSKALDADGVVSDDIATLSRDIGDRLKDEFGRE